MTYGEESRWHSFWRALWVAAAALAVFILLASIPGYLTRTPLGNLRSDLVFDPTPLSLTLIRLSTLLSFLSGAFSIALAALLFVKRSQDRVGLFLAFYLLAHGVLFAGPIEMLEPFWPDAARVNSFILLPLVTGPATVALVSIFPDGRFVPGWSRWLILASLFVVPVGWFLGPGELPAPDSSALNLTAAVGGAIALLVLGWIVYIPVYRYRRVSTPEQRQQTKWVVYGLVMTILLQVLSAGPWIMMFNLPPGSLIPPWFFLASLIFVLATTVFPATLTLSLMKYRLYEVDILINRTLVYGALTALLAIVYFGSVVLLQRVFPAQSQIAVVFSTLTIAALFAPLRGRMQALIDLRFYRHRYDAERTLAAFSATVRDEVDLESVSASLLSIVEETMQPVHLSLWLSQTE